jgi:hypothetical protein
MASLQFTFNETRHEYFVPELGSNAPGVTEVLTDAGLSDFSGIDPLTLARKAELGRQVHLACEFFDYDDLDEGTVPPECAGYFEAYKRFRSESGFEPRLIEHRMVVKLNGMPVGMTLDREGVLDGDSYLLDLKTPVKPEPWWSLQTAAYAAGLRVAGFGLTRRRASLQLRDDGTYRLHRHDNQREDEQVFMYALALTWWKRNHGIGGKQR